MTMETASSDPSLVKLVNALVRRQARRHHADGSVAQTMIVAGGLALALTQGVNPLVQAV